MIGLLLAAEDCASASENIAAAVIVLGAFVFFGFLVWMAGR